MNLASPHAINAIDAINSSDCLWLYKVLGTGIYRLEACKTIHTINLKQVQALGRENCFIKNTIYPRVAEIKPASLPRDKNKPTCSVRYMNIIDYQIWCSIERTTCDGDPQQTNLNKKRS